VGQKTKKNNIRDSPIVTDLSTDRSVTGLNIAEWTGYFIFLIL